MERSRPRLRFSLQDEHRDHMNSTR